MKVLAALLLTLAFGLGLAHAAGTDDTSGLSPEAKALKAKYDAQMQALNEQFMKDLAALSAGKPIPAAPAAKKNWYDNILINGYFQARFNAKKYDSTHADFSEFNIRRYYMNVIAHANPKTTAVATYTGNGPSFRDGNAATWENMFVEYYPDPEWTLRIGQCPNFFGLDAAESSSVRVTCERALVTEGNYVLGLNGLYFAGPSDRGAWFVYDMRPDSPSKKQGFRFVGAIYNGQFQATEKNGDKGLEADAEYFDTWGQAGISWVNGKYTNTAAAGSPTADRNAIGANVRILPAPFWGFQAEWLDGKWLGTERDGWYAQASFGFNAKQNLAFARYEEFDPNKDVENNSYKALHLGVKHNLTSQDQLTLEGVAGKLGNGSVSGGTATTNDLIFQYQRSF